ncbi:hypothetical protein GCM10009804_46790 [Kribbella hippodromi]|uniref:PknH-like extracellular domain-containing protein n=1 Tax=Kribbella hippodromi TaxID=434347 RepID=A0ABN2DU01_9ACTN
MSNFRRSVAVAGAAVVLVVSGCSGGSGKESTDAAGGGAAPSSSSPTPSTPSTSSTPSVVTPPPSPSATAPKLPTRTAAELTKALLALTDLPAGFAIDTDTGGDGSDVKVSSKDPRCARLVMLTNADTLPGSKASAGRSYSGGEQGPFIDESLDALGSKAAVGAFQQSFKKAITGCRTMSLAIAGQGRSTITVREVSAPKAGTDPVAVRFSASGGSLDGLEITMSTTGVDDVLLAVTVVAGVPDDLEGAMGAAADKAKATLGARAGA